MNAAKLPQEWAISQPKWDSDLPRNIVQEPKPGPSGLQNSKISIDEPKAGPSGIQNLKRKRSDVRNLQTYLYIFYTFYLYFGTIIFI